MQIEKTKSGFTLIELSLSIAFIAVLSIIVVIMIGNAVSAYHKGLTLNQVNTVGMELVDDMRTTVQNSPGKLPIDECSDAYSDPSEAEKCENAKAEGFVHKERYATVKPRGGSESDKMTVPIYGVFCTGEYSYLWNSGYLFNGDYTIEGGGNIGGGLKLKYKTIEGGTFEKSNFKLYKVQDSERLVCKLASGYVVGNEGTGYGKGTYNTNFANLTDNKIDISSIASNGEATDLLEGSSNLRIYDLTSGIPAENGISNNIFYSVSFILGTVQGGIDVAAMGCEAPNSGSVLESFDYCAINKFNFAATATGE
ncbi:MAG: hypothetical protein K6G49_02760 [Candidatus Saccharibacteria bacterium]|nr:hypothetical protein [Candidatus Saccharibacteria bacterium]